MLLTASGKFKMQWLQSKEKIRKKSEKNQRKNDERRC